MEPNVSRWIDRPPRPNAHADAHLEFAFARLQPGQGGAHGLLFGVDRSLLGLQPLAVGAPFRLGTQPPGGRGQGKQRSRPHHK